MAKRGGFPGGLPGNMNNLMKQAQRMQRQMEENSKKLEETKKELEAKEFAGKAGGGAVEVIFTGDKQVKSLTIAKDAVDPDDVEMLQDMIMAAINDAMGQINVELAKIDEASSQMMGGMTGGLGF